MSICLAVDTSAGTSVAILSNGQLVAEVNIEDNMKHAERIGAAIRSALMMAELQPSQVARVVVGRGPAPFTGLRVGIAAGQMFAAGLGVPCYSVVSLDALAFASFEADPQTASISQQQPLLVTSDARRGEVYWALYQTRDQHRVPIRTGEPAVLKPELLEELLAARQLNPVRNTAKISAGWVALLAQAQLEAGVLSKDISPLYLRPADATVPKGAVGKRVSG